MKLFKFNVCILIIFFVCTNAYAGELVGKICIQLEIDNKKEILPFYVTEIETGSYILSGASHLNLESPMAHGEAQIREQQLIISVQWTQETSRKTEISKGQFNVNMKSLDGKGWFFYKTFWKSKKVIDEDYKDAINVKIVGCK